MNKRIFVFLLMVASCFSVSAESSDEASVKPLVVFFSNTGHTAGVARLVGEVTGADLYEILPEEPYTEQDLDWTDKTSRSTLEMRDPAARPSLKKNELDLSGYHTIYIGFPIWWDLAPRIINTWIDANQLEGKELVPFATSGGSAIDHAADVLRETYPDYRWLPGKLLNRASKDYVAKWLGK